MANNEMVQSIDIGDTGRKMVITKHKNGSIKSVKSDDGSSAHETTEGIRIGNELRDESGAPGHFRSDILGMRDGTVIFTHHNPTCCWYYSGGTWYWLCY
jgi:hypothetical protein